MRLCVLRLTIILVPMNNERTNSVLNYINNYEKKEK